ncbi:TPR repeat protein [Natranaerovirga pectinivora]|uniref:TPR repeat protein n=1 Tax=Natranaerovirga pectinivora TaxID=682400 RepID=A0A4R3MP28_9FIRM|nr:tetratricopeptide repeat protein [Natranaerovirga pectinivora]TCT16021.1 TPR repeat protein [Natranaerovirga pectinivora]
MGLGSWIRQISLKSKLKKGNIDAAYELANMYLSDTSLSNNEVTGIEYLIQAAQGNVVKAQSDLAKYYLEGKYVTQNTQIAMQWLLSAADNGSESALNDLKNLVERVDSKIAFQWFEKFAAENSKNAYLILGNYYYRGIEGSVPINYNLASEAYLKAMSIGINTVELPYSNLISIGSYFYYQAKKYEMAVYWCNIAADLGDLDSKYILGRCYFDGTGVEKDFQQAFLYFKDSAESGIVESKKYLGICYMYGYGTQKNSTTALQLYNEVSSTYPEVFNYIGQYYIKKKDFTKAVLNYEKADALGIAVENKEEFYNLALYFDEVQNYEKAVHWLNLSSKKDTSEGYYLMARYYFYGRYFQKDQKKAMEMLQNLSIIRYEPALLLLYNLYKNGEDSIEKDKSKAFSYLTSLAELDHSEAIKMLGNTYMQKDSGVVQQDYEQAAKWYDKWYNHIDKKGNISYEHLEEIGQNYWEIKEFKSANRWFSRAVEEGSVIAHNFLGKAYFEGRGMTQNFTKAIKYFKYAAEKGVFESKVYLGQCYMQGLGIASKNSDIALQLFSEVSSIYPVVYNYIGNYYINNNEIATAALNYEKADAAGVAEEKNGEFFNLALYYNEIQNYEKAVHWLSLSSSKDSNYGRFLSALYQFHGRFVTKDTKMAMEIFQQLSDEGYEQAFLKLYDIYNSGEEGIEQNKGKAFSIISRLAELGNVEAIKMVGCAYMQKDSNFMHKDYVQAAIWYDKWYNHKLKVGNVDLSHLEEIGEYYYKINEYNTASKWLIRAVEVGSKTAYVNLGNIASREGDNNKAFEYFSKAAADEVPDGLAYLANCYYIGKGTIIDYSLTYKYFEKAANKGSSIGLYGQAFCLLNNIGVRSTNEDKNKIFTLLSKAVEMNNNNAHELLSNCYELGIGTEVSIDMAIYYLCQYRDDENLLRMVKEKDYVNAYQYVKDREEYLYHKMIFTYFGKGTNRDKDAACEMFVSFYKSKTLRDSCSNHATKSTFKYRIAKDVIEEGIRYERARDYEKAKKYFKAALRFNPQAGIFLARLLFEQGDIDSLPLLDKMSNWEEKDDVYKKCRSIAHNMLGLYYEYFYSKVTNIQTSYTNGFNFKTIDVQNSYLMMEHYMKSVEDEAYKRIGSLIGR